AAHAARHDYRDLAREIDIALEHTQLGAQRAPDFRRVGAGVDPDLALAVITEARGLEDGRRRQLAQGPHQAARAVNRPERRDRDTEIGEERLLPQPVLGHMQGAPARTYGYACGQPLDRLGRNVLELEGDDVDGRREGVE